LLCSHTHVALPNSHDTLSATPVDHKSVGQARSVVLTNARLSHAHSSLHFVWPNVFAVQAKLDAGEITQSEYDLILGTHQLGNAIDDDDAGNSKPLPSDEQLTFDDLRG
jgi:hypothetical protein